MTDQHLPQRHRPVIRVFVSSTFSDLKHERNALQANFWPALERYCQQRGFQFQAIDLRWGVPTEAGLDHRTMRICFEELRRSQETSPRPNFLILLGDRCGWRPLPEEISTDEFQELEQLADDEPASLTVLNARYPLDDNAVPPVHVLRSRRDSPDGRDYTDEQNGNEVQAVLWSIINGAFSPDRLPGRFDEHVEARSTPGTTLSIVRFQASATEQEIWHGAFQVADARQHVFAFVRKIENLDESVDQGNGDRRLKDFVDLTPDGQRDTVAQNAHEALRQALHLRLGENYREITTTARLETPPNQSELDVTTDHLALLCQEVPTRLERVIDKQIRDYWQEVQAADEQQLAAAPTATSSPGPSAARIARELELEMAEHVRFGRERAPQGGFVGRESEIGSLREYLAGDDRQPLVVYGPSGTGKTALLAHVALPAVTLLGDSLPVGSPLTIVRFLGTTPGSSGVRPLLTSLCRQLRDFFPLEVELPSDFNELSDEFHGQLARATSEQPIHLFLDALDQLDDAGCQLGWLRVSPSQPLPPHVKLVASCLSDAHDTPAGAPYRRLSHPQLLDKGVKLEELSPEEAVALLFDRSLKSSLEPGESVTDPFGRPRRTLTNKQREVIERHLRRPEANECRRPLYLIASKSIEVKATD